MTCLLLFHAREQGLTSRDRSGPRQRDLQMTLCPFRTSGEGRGSNGPNNSDTVRSSGGIKEERRKAARRGTASWVTETPTKTCVKLSLQPSLALRNRLSQTTKCPMAFALLLAPSPPRTPVVPSTPRGHGWMHISSWYSLLADQAGQSLPLCPQAGKLAS